jgi:hypothetical protein
MSPTTAALRRFQMKYMLMIYSDEAAMQDASREQMAEMIGAYTAYTEAMRQSGAYVAGDRLQRSASATTVRTVGNHAKVLNGPYAETKEQLGGYYIIEVADLDAALSWARRCPGAIYGVVEVRPFFTG